MKEVSLAASDSRNRRRAREVLLERPLKDARKGGELDLHLVWRQPTSGMSVRSFDVWRHAIYQIHTASLLGTSWIQEKRVSSSIAMDGLGAC